MIIIPSPKLVILDFTQLCLDKGTGLEMLTVHVDDKVIPHVNIELDYHSLTLFILLESVLSA